MAKQTPEYGHLLGNPVLRSSVYEPEADTFLLMDALDVDAPSLLTMSSTDMLLEIGCGSGILITHLVTNVLKSVHTNSTGPPLCFAVDLNEKALVATRQTWEDTFARQSLNRGIAPWNALQLIRGDLTTMFDLFGRKGLFDVVLFNPPYVPTSLQELQHNRERNDLAIAWSGGPRGRVLIDQFVAVLPALLRPGGIAYIVVIDANDPDDILNSCGSELKGSRVLSRYTGENLLVLRFQRLGGTFS